MSDSVSVLDLMGASKFFNAVSWDPWRAMLATLFGHPMTEEQLALYRRCTGRASPPADQAREAFLIIGRRGGKSLIAALVALHAAVFRRYRLAPGERGLVMVIAADRRQARVVLRYLVGLLQGSKRLGELVERRTTEAVHFKNGISIEVHTASFRTVRGYTIVAAVCDEIAFWRDETSANPDVEILNALRPAMATVPGALLLCISSPYARRGGLWQAYRDHYGRDGDPVLVWQADTRTMNPTIDERVIREAYEQDEAAAGAEYGAEFRRDVETFISREALAACVEAGTLEHGSRADVSYVAFADPAGGSGGDSMTLAIAHAEERGEWTVTVLDVVREIRPPFSPEAAVAEFAQVLMAYNVLSVVGDRYAGDWPAEAFRRQGIDYQPSAKPKSDIYRELLPLLNAQRAALLDVSRLTTQLATLERRTARGGRDTVDHAPCGHDDVANAAAGALLAAAASRGDDLGVTVGAFNGSSLDGSARMAGSWRPASFAPSRQELEGWVGPLCLDCGRRHLRSDGCSTFAPGRISIPDLERAMGEGPRCPRCEERHPRSDECVVPQSTEDE